jgi:uncharacterized repeat protein (TIGR01451 family)
MKMGRITGAFAICLRTISAIIALVLLSCMLPSMATAQTVNQYTNTTTAAINNTTICATPIVRNFTVGTSFTVADVDVGLFMAHSWRGDISVTLQSPAGTRVTVKVGDVNHDPDNLNVILSDENTGIVDGAGHTTNDLLTPAPPPYQNALTPNNPLSAFDGQNSAGTWRLEICDIFPDADDGTFNRADLYLTEQPANFADLSLVKTVSNATPASGTLISYTLSVTNSASSPSAAAGVTVLDLLPAGVVFSSASGFGSYNSATGVWTVGSIPVGTTRTLTINVVVSATLGTTVQNGAEVSASSLVDLDSTPNNGSVNEDDDAFVSFTATGTRSAGIAPALVCPSGTSVFDWDAVSWTAGATSGNYALPSIGTMNFNIAINGGAFLNNAIYGGQAPARQNVVTGGFIPAQFSLFEIVDMTSRSGAVTNTITLPTAVPGVQFRLFDIDYFAGQFADLVTITGSFNGVAVAPTLTHGVTNFVVGNSAFGDGTSADASADGNVVVTFSSPVDTIVVTYGNHNLAPVDPGQQAISIHDFTFCNPQTTLSVTKLSSVVSDGISASNPKAIPGAIMRYCILVSNAGSATSTNVIATDVLPANVTFIPGSMFSGTSCAAASTAEDDNNSGGDETDPFGMDFAGNVVTGRAATLGPAASFAMVFNASVN